MFKLLLVQNCFNIMNNFFRKIISNNRGQALLVVVMVLGATMLGVTTIAGYITIQKIRTVTNIVDSTKAIYAADSGIDWWFYKKFVSEPASSTPPNQPTFSNDSTLEIRETETIVKSIGHAGRSYRAFGAFPEMFNPTQ
jgi:predicted PurR-regulated permease PerM